MWMTLDVTSNRLNKENGVLMQHENFIKPSGTVLRFIFVQRRNCRQTRFFIIHWLGYFMLIGFTDHYGSRTKKFQFIRNVDLYESWPCYIHQFGHDLTLFMDALQVTAHEKIHKPISSIKKYFENVIIPPSLPSWYSLRPEYSDSKGFHLIWLNAIWIKRTSPQWYRK